MDIAEYIAREVRRSAVALRAARLRAYRAYVEQAAYLTRFRWPDATAIVIDATDHRPHVIDATDYRLHDDEGVRLLAVDIGPAAVRHDLLDQFGQLADADPDLAAVVASIEHALRAALSTGVDETWNNAHLTETTGPATGAINGSRILTLTLPT